MATDDDPQGAHGVTRAERVREALLDPSTTSPLLPGMATAAVAIVLREKKQDCELLLIVRAQRPSDPWSGHVAFPGGRSEAQDASPIDTAIRETREELGVDLTARGRLLGTFEGIQAVAEGRHVPLLIVPCVFELTEEVELLPNGEVATAFFTPLAPLRSGNARSHRELSIRGQPQRVPGFWVREHFMWGLTYRMSCALLARLDRQSLRSPHSSC